MSYIISVYSNDAFKEFLLPALNNSECSIILNKKLFRLDRDIEIILEVVEEKWSFLSASGCEVLKEGVPFCGVELVHGDLLELLPTANEPIYAVVAKRVNYFAVFDKLDLRRISSFSIGKNRECAICYDGMGLVSRVHANVVIQDEHAFLEDKSANGTFVNSERINGTVRLEYGDNINIYGLRMIYLGETLAVCTAYDDVYVDWSVFDWYEVKNTENTIEADTNRKYFHRAPRKIWKADQNVIEIEAPPSIKEQQKQSLFMMVGPALTMSLPMILGCGLAIYSSRLSGSTSGAFMYTGLITAFSSAFIGVFWTLLNQSQSKKKNREEESRRFEAYSQYLIKCTDLIREKYEKNMNALKNMYLDAAICCRYDIDNPNLWGRNSRQSDYMTHRLGIGELPFQVKITIPKERFNLINDSLNAKPAMIQEEYKTLFDVPICVDIFNNKLIGIVGGKDKKGAYEILKILSAQVAANNAYTEVKLIYLMEESSSEEVITYAKWFPHVWSEDRKTRYVAQNRMEVSEVLYELAKTLRIRSEESNYNNGKKIPKPYYVIFIDNIKVLEGEPVAKYLFEAKQEYGVSTFLLANEYEELPNECEYIIRNDPEYTGMYRTEDDSDDRTFIKFDQISNYEIEELARNLSAIELNEIELGGEIPTTLTFFEMYGVTSLDELNVMERWKKNRNYDSMKALIGQKSGGAPCFLDVHEKYHGPHGLVAGTTGSGKSETLQTYILSLALNFSPDDVGFFVIDYKGGGMANLFEGLPHMIGQISNLSGNQVRRAMVSIKSENMRRQRLFNEHGVNNINLYTKLYKNNEATIPIPHMFIVIDEFAELKREEPEFMRELISVAQVGRSLGVHLILATQKPSGTVDDNIWSNSKFKLCLRVQDKQDSNDMLHKPDAAYITQAGRCYLQVGNDEIYELFQSGWSGAVYSQDKLEKSEVAKLLSLHGRTAIIGNKSRIEQKERVREAWLEGLLYIVDGALRDAKTTAKECIANPAIAQKIICDIFERLENANISYPISEYNTRRLEDLINLFASFPEKQEYGIPAEARQFFMLAEKEQKKLPEEKEKTQLDAVVECLATVAEKEGYKRAFQLWLPILPRTLFLSELEGYKEHIFDGSIWPATQGEWNLEVLIGLYDDPVNQSQKPVSISFSQNGHYAICGMVVSGKSTLLQTIVYSMIQKYTPQYINLYMIDFSSKMLSCFEKAPHVGGVMYENENDKIDKFFTMMMGILEQRKNILKGGSYGQFVKSQGVRIPAIFVVIDNYAGFREKTAGNYDDLILQLSRDGSSYGMYLLISSAGFGSSEIPNRIGDNIRNVVCLEMSDKFQYGDALRVLHIDVMPETDIRGRGLAFVGNSVLEFQAALAIQACDDYERAEHIRESCNKMDTVWHQDTARKIPEIPDKVTWAEFEKVNDVQEMNKNGLKLTMGYHMKNASIYGVDLSSTYCYLISGKTKTGKTNCLKVLMKAASLQKGELCVIDNNLNELEEIAKSIDATYIVKDEQMFQYWKTLIPVFTERNRLKKELIQQGLEDDEIFAKMLEFKKYFIFIADLNNFVNSIEKSKDGVGDMKGFMENITDKGFLHNIYFFGCMNSDDRSLFGKPIFENFIRDRKGIHFGGNIQSQRVFGVEGISYQEQTKTYKSGIGMLADINESESVKVVVPFVRGI